MRRSPFVVHVYATMLREDPRACHQRNVDFALNGMMILPALWGGTRNGGS